MSRLMPFGAKRTEPSPIRTFTPPMWRLPVMTTWRLFHAV